MGGWASYLQVLREAKFSQLTSRLSKSNAFHLGHHELSDRSVQLGGGVRFHIHRLLFGFLGGRRVGGWFGWGVEKEAVGMSCCGSGQGGWVGGWVRGFTFKPSGRPSKDPFAMFRIRVVLPQPFFPTMPYRRPLFNQSLVLWRRIFPP